MVHDASSGPQNFNQTGENSLKDLFKLQLLCERMNLSPIGVARLVKGMRTDIGNLMGKTENEIGFDAEFFGREFDLVFSFPDPSSQSGKRNR